MDNNEFTDLSEPEGENLGTTISNVAPPNLSHPLPVALRPLSHFLKLGQDHLKIDYIIAYWCYYYAAEKGLTLDKSTEGRGFIEIILKWLEDQNLQHREEEAIVHNLVAEAYIEKYILDLMVKVDGLERSRTYNKNTVKLLYTIGFLCETLQCFHDEMSQDFVERMKYSKWRAAYIHKCLKYGETPQPSESERQELDTRLDMNVPSIPNVEEISGIIPGYVNGNIGNTSSNNPNVLPLPHPQPTSDFDDAVKEFSDSAEGSHHEVSFEEIKLILEAQRLSTIAVSCLDYKDIDTAKDLMRKALGILEKIKSNRT